MARVLILSRFYPADIDSGEYIRVGNLCKQLGRHHECYLVYLGTSDESGTYDREIGIEKSIAIPDIPDDGRSFFRHFRFGDSRFLRRSVPNYLNAAQNTVSQLCLEWKIDIIVCLAPNISEFVDAINLPKVLDFCDCVTLAIKRMLSNRQSSFSIRERVNLKLRLIRYKDKERALLKQFDHTTTISDPDRHSLLQGAGVPSCKVSVIANGVAHRALMVPYTKTGQIRSVVFWGNLDFAPNWTALEYFYENIYVPYLAEEGIEFHIIGRGAGSGIEKMLLSPGVVIHGYVEQLYQEIGRHGVMVNPMVEGGGLKNKVLEAFACHVPVVSTSLGIDSIDAEPGKHFLRGDSPLEFAKAVKRVLSDQELATRMRLAARQLVEQEFMWDGIGDQFCDLVDQIAVASIQEANPA